LSRIVTLMQAGLAVYLTDEAEIQIPDSLPTIGRRREIKANSGKNRWRPLAVGYAAIPTKRAALAAVALPLSILLRFGFPHALTALAFIIMHTYCAP
jgi:hypothetical protein